VAGNPSNEAIPPVETLRPATGDSEGLPPQVPNGGGSPENPEEEPPLLPGSGAEESGRVTVRTNEVHEALRAFYSKLAWQPQDALKLWETRGLAPSTCEAAGLRSNISSNLGVLQSLHPRFSVEVLERAGLWERTGSDVEWNDEENGVAGLDGRGRPTPIRGCVPSRFFYGYGVIGSERGPDGTKRLKYGWNHPPIIPYFDLIPIGDTDGFESALVTEGEYKALAVWQVFCRSVPTRPPSTDLLVGLRTHKKWGRGAVPLLYMTPVGSKRIGIAAVPGIDYLKTEGGTWDVGHMLDEWLLRNRVRQCWTIFDNEEKGNPNLPGYNPDVEQRFNAAVMALYFAKKLWRTGCKGLFSMLPDELQDERGVYWRRDREGRGKADWDGLLRAMLTRLMGEETKQQTDVTPSS
jgi:hypothetical protein